MLQNGGGNGIDAVSVTHGTDRSLGDSRSGPAIAAQLLDCTPRARCRNLIASNELPEECRDRCRRGGPRPTPGYMRQPRAIPGVSPFQPEVGRRRLSGARTSRSSAIGPEAAPRSTRSGCRLPGSGSDALWTRFDRPSGWRPPADLKSFEGGPARRLSGRIDRGSGRANASSSSEDRYGSRKADPLGVPYHAKTSFEPVRRVARWRRR